MIFVNRLFETSLIRSQENKAPYFFLIGQGNKACYENIIDNDLQLIFRDTCKLLLNKPSIINLLFDSQKQFPIFPKISLFLFPASTHDSCDRSHL